MKLEIQELKLLNEGKVLRIEENFKGYDSSEKIRQQQLEEWFPKWYISTGKDEVGEMGCPR